MESDAALPDESLGHPACAAALLDIPQIEFFLGYVPVISVLTSWMRTWSIL